MTLQQLTEAIHEAKFKDMPHCEARKDLFPTRPFTEKGANELTRSIEAFIRYTGNYADRINNTGIYDAKLKKFRKYNVVLAFVISALYAGCAGSLAAHLTPGFLHPNNYTIVEMVTVLLMVVIGGIGHVWGGIVGAVIVTIIFDLTRDYYEYQLLIFGLVIVLTVMYMPTGIGGLKSFESCMDNLYARGPDRTSPFAIVQIIPNLAAGWVSMELGTRGPLLAECTACAASNMAIGDSADAIRLGRADVMICGGTESPVTRVGIAGFNAMRAISRRNDDPARASRPFDLERDGFVMGEASAMLVLEELEHARARGAKIYAELLGYGCSSDANHVSDPDPTGANPARAMTMAIADAGISPEDVDYVNAHGTSTLAGDSAETRVLKLALGEEKAYRTPVSSTKGSTGHCLGAAGAIEAIFTALALQRGVLPPTINQFTPDPECDLDYIPNESREQQVEIGVSNSFGFGGHNACVVLRRWDEAA